MNALRVLRNLVAPEPVPAHGELEHAHWDRESRTWRAHDGEPQGQAETAA